MISLEAYRAKIGSYTSQARRIQGINQFCGNTNYNNKFCGNKNFNMFADDTLD